MLKDRNTRAPRTASETSLPTAPIPINRQLVESVVKELKEQCPKCGHFVIFKVLSTAATRKQVWCPDCGARHCIYPETDTIRPVNQSTPR